MEIDKKIIKKLIEVLEELKKSTKDINIDIDTIKTVEEEVDETKTVNSPIIGTAYLAPEPGGKNFVEIGVGNYRESNTRYLYNKYHPKGLIIDCIENMEEKVNIEMRLLMKGVGIFF